jgi:hypothetical protein
MLGRKLLVALGQSVGLSGLDEAANALGVFFDIHAVPPWIALPS